jgi:hypothetical protein
MVVRYVSALKLQNVNGREDFLCEYADGSVQELTREGHLYKGAWWCVAGLYELALCIRRTRHIDTRGTAMGRTCTSITS